MGGGKRGRRQQKAEDVSGAARERETTQAEELRGELQRRRSMVGEGLPETLEATRTGAQDLRETGGYRPEEIEPVRRGYGDFAETGGFGEGDKEKFLRRATAPVTAVYSRAQDELNRRAAVQGGYGTGFDAAGSRLTRQKSQALSEASLGANVELSNLVRSGRLAGIGGLANLAESTRTGRIAGQDALQRYTQLGVAGLSDVDMTELRNRLQSGQISQADAQLLTVIAAQDKTLFEKIMQGIGTVAGGAAGLGEAF